MMNKVYAIFFFNVFVLATSANAQTKKIVKDGNNQYNNKDYNGAVNTYNKALKIDPKNDKAMFNLGNAYYKNNAYEDARKVATTYAKATTDKKKKAEAFYNIGNTYMKEKKWQEAVDVFKQSLRNNPQDADAKYNLAYAQQMLNKQNQQNKDDKKNDDKDKKDNKDDKKDKQDDKKKDDKKQDSDEDKKDNKKKDQDKQDDIKDKGDKQTNDKQQTNDDKKNGDNKNAPQPAPSKLTEQQADQLLNALQQEEKKLQDKIRQGKATTIQTDKDW